MRDDIDDWLTLVALPGVGCGAAHRLLAAFASPAQVLAAGKDVARVAGIGKRLASVFSDQPLLDRTRAWAERERERAQAGGISLLPVDDPLYPPLLSTIQDPPVLLYLKGNIGCLARSQVAIIGSRAASDYGKRVSATLARDLALAGLGVVSGLALGVDGHAHAGCLEAGGDTTAVLGCGVDVVYPRSHGSLYGRIRESGLLISEYPLGTRPEGFRFPARNRIISGLCLGVIVVEATCRSGSLITARLALDQNREVFGVPGRVDSKKSEGVHRLLQQGAHLVQGADDVICELKLAMALEHEGRNTASEKKGQALSRPEEELLSLLDVYPLDIDELSEISGHSSGALHDLLLRLELKGLVRQLPGQQYERVTG